MKWDVKKQIRKTLCPDIAQLPERCEWCRNMLHAFPNN